MDNMLEMYLYETNTLLEQLDELLIEAEKMKILQRTTSMKSSASCIRSKVPLL